MINGMIVFGKDNISVSEVLQVINGGPPANADPEMSRRGILEHKSISSNVKQGILPPVLVRAGLTQPVQPEKTLKTTIANGLTLSARADMVAPTMTVDAKPGVIKGRHLLQVGLTCVARNEPCDGTVYLYHHGQAYVMMGGAGDATPELKKIAVNSRQILDIQTTLSNRSSIKGAAREALGRQSVSLRTDIDKNLGVALTKMKTRLVVFG